MSVCEIGAKRSRKSVLLMNSAILALWAASALAPVMAQDNAKKVEFDIQADTLEDALKSYSLATDRQVMFSTDIVERKAAKPVSGQMTADEALVKLLDGSGLVYEATPSSNVILVRVPQKQAMLIEQPRQRAQAQPEGVRERRPGAEREDTEGDDRKRDEITVTGTLIKGIAPESSPVYEYDRRDILATGAQDLDQFLRTVPQASGAGASNLATGGFAGDLDATANFNSFSSTINLRGLGGNATLTLLNGRRLAPSGGAAAFVDVSSIPLSAIQRVEILADGASSIYGSDAIAGVVNFILRDDYEGFETLVDYGLVTEGNFDRIRVSQTGGFNWEGGNALVSYEFFDQDSLLASEKEFSEPAADPFSLAPSQTRHAVTAFVSQEVTTTAKFDLTAYYGNRDTRSFANFAGFGAQTIERSNNAAQLLISPSLTLNLKDDWSVTLAGDYSKVSEDATEDRFSNVTGDLVESSEPTNDSEFATAEIITDGGLFDLAAGSIRVAIGASFRSESFESTQGGQTLSAERDIYAAFGELFIPIVSDLNRVNGIERLEFSVSGRFDHYDDVGSTTNPKVGVLWSPVEGLRLRGTYSTSFTPPTLSEIPGQVGPFAFLLLTDNPATGDRDVTAFLANNGFVDDLQPETSRSLTGGFDFDHSFGDSQISLSSTYYDISFDNRIAPLALPPGVSVFNALLFADQLPSDAIYSEPSAMLVSQYTSRLAEEGGQLIDYVQIFSGMPGNLEDVSAIIDFRRRNIASTTGLPHRSGPPDLLARRFPRSGVHAATSPQ
ncbi:TonB-dependent receptor [Henriciella aquimarina]|uniref:TonB-dependent receptor n=1 Tax=Henriciella aquimarina TaxID=545261 RepID=UPI000A0066D3|nr:TonB-dependent receptor [Henriciella aquimarina]